MIGRLMMKYFLRDLRTRNIKWYLKLNKMYVIVFSVLRCFFFFDGWKLCLLLIVLYSLLKFMCIGMILSDEFIRFLWEIKVFFLWEIRVFFLGWLDKVIDGFWFVFLGIFILFNEDLIFTVILIIILELRLIVIFVMHLYFKMPLFRLGLRLEIICLILSCIEILLVFFIILIDLTGLVEVTFQFKSSYIINAFLPVFYSFISHWSNIKIWLKLQILFGKEFFKFLIINIL